MTHSTQENTTQDFNCPRAGQSVQVEQTFDIHVSRAGKRLGRKVIANACSHMDQCGIASSGPSGKTYDWSQCAFLHPQGSKD